MEKKVNTKNVQQRKLLFLMAFLLWFSQYVYVPYQTPFLKSIGVTSMLVGMIVGVYGLPQFLLRVPIGLMADRKPRHKFFITLGVAATGIASIFRIILPNATGFLLGSIFSGIASSVWVSFTVLYCSYFSRSEQNKATGQIFAACNLGILGGFIAASACFAKFGMSFLCMMGILASFSAILMVLFLKEPTTNESDLTVKQLLAVVGDKRLLFFSSIALVQQGMVAATALSFTTQVAKALAVNEMQVGICAIIYISTACISSFLTGRKAVESIGIRAIILMILCGLVFYCVAVPWATSIGQVMVLQILPGMSQGMLLSYCTSQAMRNIPVGKKSTAMGIYQSIYAIGITAFPMIMGSVFQASSVNIAFYCMGLFALVAFFATLFFLPRKKNTMEKR